MYWELVDTARVCFGLSSRLGEDDLVDRRPRDLFRGADSFDELDAIDPWKENRSSGVVVETTALATLVEFGSNMFSS
jgi:hypothetical protein